MIVARSLKCVANQTRACTIMSEGHLSSTYGHTLLETKASAIAKAMANPSRVLVPRPSSSTMALSLVSEELVLDTLSLQSYKLRRSMLRKMNEISFISAANVDTFVSMLSSMPSRAKSWWCIGKEAYVAGTLSIVSMTLTGDMLKDTH